MITKKEYNQGLAGALIGALARLVTRALYRLEVRGAENIPAAGPALLVSNHISYMDGVVLLTAQPRPLHFLLTRDVYDGWPLLTPVFRAAGCIPIEMSDPPKKIVASLREARRRLDAGHLVGIFAEGELTRNGMLRGFRKGLAHIVKDSEHPVIPVYIGGAWGTITSYLHGRFVKKWRRRGRDTSTVIFGKPLPAHSGPAETRLAVMELSCAYFESGKAKRGTLPEALRLAAADPAGAAVCAAGAAPVSRSRLLGLAGGVAAALADQPQGNVGVLLKLSGEAAAANLGAVMSGRAAVNLDGSLPPETLAARAAAAGVSVFIVPRSSPAAPPGAAALVIEDIREAAPPERRLHPDETAAVVFTSGFTGEPKPVMLSHHNILSSAEAMRLLFDFEGETGVCTSVPLHHALGATASLWVPLAGGVTVHCHPDPADREGFARLAAESGATTLFATPSQLRYLTRNLPAEALAHVRRVITAGRRLPLGVAAAFEEKFGVRPLEAYGSAEAAPVAALSVPHALDGKIFQAGWKEGSAGLALPGLAAKVTDADGLTLPPGGRGQLLLKGPAVMKGYYGRPDLTAAAVRDGWYHTGDEAFLDEDGFIHITGRLALRGLQ